MPDIRSWFGIDRPLYLVAHSPGAGLAPDGTALVHAMRNLRPDERPSPTSCSGRPAHAGPAHRDPQDDVVLERYLHRMVVVSASVTPAGGGLAGRPGLHDTGLDVVLVAGDWVGPTGWLADGSLVSGAAAGAAAAAGSPSTGDDPPAPRPRQLFAGRAGTPVNEDRAERFTAERARLVGLAYRMLGSRTDAEDVVQEAWLRYAAGDRGASSNRRRGSPPSPAGWPSTACARRPSAASTTSARGCPSPCAPFGDDPAERPTGRRPPSPSDSSSCSTR